MYLGNEFVVVCQVGPAVPAAVLAVALVRQVVLELGPTHGSRRPSDEASKALTHKLRPRSDFEVEGLPSGRECPRLLSKHSSLSLPPLSTVLLSVLCQTVSVGPVCLHPS